MDNKKFNLYLELALFIILGFLLGAVIKTEAAKRITIGFNDNKARTLKQEYDLVKMQKGLSASQDSGNNANASNTNQSGGSCNSQ